MTLSIEPAGPDDAPDIAALRNTVADHLTGQYGHGHWSSQVSVPGLVRALANDQILVARFDHRIVATARMASKKPWAIDPSYFAGSKRPIYLHDMAVDPPRQREGIGRQLLFRAAELARGGTRDAIRLDAYDGPAGAGDFYRKCGYREVGRVIYRGTPLIYFELIL